MRGTRLLLVLTGIAGAFGAAGLMRRIYADSKASVALAPRPGMIDTQGHLWFGQNRANKIGMFDTKTQKFQEWDSPTPEFFPYDVAADKNGEAWAIGEFADSVLRLEPRTGQFTEYPMPRFTNMRRAFVDNSTTPVTFWVGNTHGASIVKLEPLN